MRKRITMYLDKIGVGVSSKENYRRYLGYIFDWLEDEGIDPSQLTPSDFRRFLATKNWSNASEYHALVAMRGFLKSEHGADHPLLAMGFKREDPGPQRTLRPEEITQVMAAFNNFPIGIRNKAVFLLMLDTGLRASEVCRLTLEHLDIENQTLTVRRKGGAWKISVYSLETAQSIEAWLKIRESTSDNVFVGIGGIKPGQPITRDGLRSIFRVIAQKAGVKHFSPHALRRTFATESLKNGAPSRLVQVAGGWNDIAMVERYSQAIQAEDFRGYFPAAQYARKRHGPGDSPTHDLGDAR